jgi:hypothetical protein
MVKGGSLHFALISLTAMMSVIKGFMPKVPDMIRHVAL